jgi:hypothetical protein
MLPPNTGLSPMMMTFDQFNTPAQPEKNVHQATAEELANPTQAPTGAIRTKSDSVLNQARQIYTTQLTDKNA